MKKILSTILSLAIIIANLSSTNVFAAGYDTTAPLVNGISFKSTELTSGETLEITIDVTEEETGLSKLYAVMNGKVINATVDASCLSGEYVAYYEIPEDIKPGEYHIYDVVATDIAGNTSHNGDFADYTINISNPNYVEDDAPIIIDTYPEYYELEVPGTQIINVLCNDTDLASIKATVNYIDNGGNSNYRKEVTYEVEELSENGLYKIEIPYNENDNLISGNFDYVLTLKDKTNHSRYGVGESTTRFYINYNKPEDKPEQDLEAPVITSITSSDTDLKLPAVSNITISGTENTPNSKVTGYVTIANTELTTQLTYINFEANVDDNGNWSVTKTFTLGKNAKSGTYRTISMSVTDSNNVNSFTDALPLSWNVSHEDENISIETTLANPNLIQILSDMTDNGTAIIRATSNTIPADIFSTINGTNKTVVLDMDGLQWIFNGKDIKEEYIKDIDITTLISDSNIEEFGYEEDSTGVILEFASNGFLPGTAKIRIKSDYITNKYNLSSKLYLACIRETVEYVEEIIYTDYVWPTDEEGNTIYYTVDYKYDEEGNIIYSKNYIFDEEGNPVYKPELDEEGNIVLDEEGNIVYSDEQEYVESPEYVYTFIEPTEVERIEYINKEKEQLVQIEDCGITLDENGYVTITMTHNSSYILSTELPKPIKLSSDNNELPNQEDTNNINIDNNTSISEVPNNSTNNIGVEEPNNDIITDNNIVNIIDEKEEIISNKKEVISISPNVKLNNRYNKYTSIKPFKPNLKLQLLSTINRRILRNRVLINPRIYKLSIKNNMLFLDYLK